MYKSILAAVTILSFSQVTLAADKSDIWQCMDLESKAVNSDCMVKTIELHSKKDDFFDQLARKQIEPKADAFSTIKYFPAQSLIQVKSFTPESDVLIAANK
ncbi:hypothetical protein tloyanaT_35330 [Thalassotalea loyana]|uniref:Pyridine nucleotide transhydrogenase n=1 Tax=Thalassotalea loyana TaxID=280483 RepID=A0ABQ6HJP4_9GAMM|nr:hypothetical protein [Thalassotalea loyana]GLX87280.1 hypothetical protein tloyanaT_35330 [Thalassotalea loyana]